MTAGKLFRSRLASSLQEQAVVKLFEDSAPSLTPTGAGRDTPGGAGLRLTRINSWRRRPPARGLARRLPPPGFFSSKTALRDTFS
jgi:hypothetical protein